MRKEISFYFKEKKLGKRVFLGISLVLLFIIMNGFLIYAFNFNNYYFSVVKKIIPYPAFIFGKSIITIGDYENEINLNKKIYESAYRIDFSSKADGVKNIEMLRKNVREDILDRLIMEEYLREVGKEVTKKDIRSEYEEISKDVGSDKEIRDILKYTSNIGVDDIKNKIYLNLLRERMKESIIYSLKIRIISLKPEDINSEVDWSDVKSRADSAVIDIGGSLDKFNSYYFLYNKDDDSVVKNFSGGYVTAEDLPESFQQSFYSLDLNEVSNPIKTDSGYYIIIAEEKKGYYKGSLDDFLKEQKDNLRVWSFID